MSEFLQFLFLGLGQGAIYATLAVALVIIYRATGLLNFAQGEMAMFCTFVIWMAWDVGLPFPLAVLVGMAFGFVMGAVIQLAIIAPVTKRAHGNPLPVVMVTIGLFLALSSLAPIIWGTDAKVFPVAFGEGSIELFGASITHRVLGTLAILGLEVVVLWLIFQRTSLGLAMRAVASNEESSALAGVPVGRMLMIGWGMAAAFGALAGGLAAYVGLTNTLMLVPLIYAFAAATLGGFDSPGGAVVGGLVVGVVTELSAHYIPFIGNDLKLLPAFLLILIVLLVRPQGLFGKRQVVRV